MRRSSLPTVSALALPLFVALVGCSGSEGAGDEAGRVRVGQQASAVQGGTTDTSALHSYAVGVANKLGGVCSGTLIAPNLVLTARHCVVPPTHDVAVTCADTFPANVEPDKLVVTTDPNIYRASSYYAASAVITPTATGFCGNDIALIILTENIPEAEATPAVPVVQFKMTDSRLGGGITAMGYGITSPTATDSGQRHIRQHIPLICVPGSKDLDCSGDLAKFSENAAEFVTEGHVCSGDSGGGAFDQESFDKGTPYVLGALSRGPQTADKCLAAIYSRTDAHAQLIVDAGTKAAEQGHYAPPSWAALAPDSANPADPACEGDTCTATSPTEPGPQGGASTPSTTTGCSVGSRLAGERSAGGGAAFAGLAIAALFSVRRRRRA